MIPSAVSGTPGGKLRDKDGKEIDANEYQNVIPDEIIPTLVLGIQQLKVKIDRLDVEIAALKA